MGIAGEMFGPYMLLDRVASGGMAEVWRAKISGSDDFQRIIAIKKILPHVAEDDDFISMFRDEAKITVQLQHANIGQVFDFNKVGDVYYIAMEYIPGKDLKTVWNHQRKTVKTPLDFGLACYVAQQMAEGLDYAHRKTDNFGNELVIVHRDVSPQNVLLSWDGEVKVIDFGIAKAAGKAGRTQAGVLKGKFGYMAPEQIRGIQLDGRADVFALGVVLYEMLCGQRAFQAKSDFALLEKVRKVQLVPPRQVNPNIPQELERIVMRSVAKNRDERYASATEFSQDLQRFLLMEGRPPTRYDLADYLKGAFQSDYAAECQRTESYRELKPGQAPPPAAQAPAAQAPTTVEDMPLGDQTVVAPPDFEAMGAEASQPTEQSDLNNGYTRMVHPQGQKVMDVGNKKAANLKKLGMGLGIFLSAILLVTLFIGKGSGTVAITVTGAEQAKVLIDGEIQGEATPNLNLDAVSVGLHVLTVSAEGYEQHLEQIEMAKGQLLKFKIDLKRKKAAPGKFKVSSNPPGATIFLNGEDTGKKSPAAFSVDSEVPHILKLVLANHHSHSETNINIEPKETKNFDVKLKPSSILIKVLSKPSGADVVMNGELLGQTPYLLKHDPSGGYPKITVKKRSCRGSITTSVPYDPEVAEMDFPVTLKGCR